MSQASSELKRDFSAEVLGLAFTRSGFAVAGKKRRLTREIFVHPGEAPWFDDRGMATADFDYAKIRTAVEGTREHTPVHMMLPNPAVRFLAVRTPERLRTRRETEQLLHWHAERLGAPLGASSVMDYQWTGKTGKEHNLFAISMPGGLLTSLLATTEPRCVRWLLPSAVYLLKANPSAGVATVLVDLDHDSWAVLVLDANGHVRAARRGWRYPSDHADSIAGEARRLVNAAGNGCEPGAITAWCPSSEWKTLEASLQRNFSTTDSRCIRNVGAAHAQSEEVQTKAALAASL